MSIRIDEAPAVDAHDAACGVHCAHCALDSGDPPAAPAPGELHGGSFVRASAGYFLVPVILACGGAVLGGSPLSQLIGAAVGFALGMVASTWVAGRQRASKEAAWQQR